MEVVMVMVPGGWYRGAVPTVAVCGTVVGGIMGTVPWRHRGAGLSHSDLLQK